MPHLDPIRSDADLARAIEDVSHYFDNPPEPGSEDADRFDMLSDLIEAYEGRHHPIEAPDPITLIREFMAMTDRDPSDLARLLGSRSRASEVLARKRALSVSMIRKLNAEWGVPSDCLIPAYRLDGRADPRERAAAA